MTERSEHVTTEVRGRVLVITLNRPDHLNAIDSSISLGIHAALDDLETSPEIGVGVLTAAGRGFCCGLDLKAFAKSGAPERIDELVRRAVRKPLIAAVEGFAFGGGLEIALLCDLLVASSDAKFGLPEPKVGLFAAGGGLLRLPNRIDHATATRMALTGESIDGPTALACGLLIELTSPGEALLGALRLADKIAANAPLSVQATKSLLDTARDGSPSEFWAAQKRLFRDVLRSDDATEGRAAFAEKRQPVWSGS